MRSDEKSKLIEIVKRLAVKYGKFTLSSGAVVDYYIDCRKVTLCSEGLAQVLDGIEQIAFLDTFVAIGGPSLGADPIVGGFLNSTFDPVQGFLVRKETKQYGMQNLIEGYEIQPGDRVIVVEDVVTSGASVLHAIQAVQGRGGIVTKVIVVLDRLAGARQKIEELGIEFYSLLTIEDLGLGNG